MLKFDFSNHNVTDDDVKEAIKPKARTSKFFTPGRYALKILKAEIGRQNDSDPTWYSVKLELGGIDERVMRATIMLPTASPEFNKPGIRNKLFLFVKFQQFVEALGERCSTSDLNVVVPKLFGGGPVFKGLQGRTVDVTIGYDRHYIDRVDNSYRIFEPTGQEFIGDGSVVPLAFADRDAAKLGALAYSLNVQAFPDVLTYHKAEVQADESDDFDD